jgi:hypothetical protein
MIISDASKAGSGYLMNVNTIIVSKEATPAKVAQISTTLFTVYTPIHTNAH